MLFLCTPVRIPEGRAFTWQIRRQERWSIGRRTSTIGTDIPTLLPVGSKSYLIRIPTDGGISGYSDGKRKRNRRTFWLGSTPP
jgi:hypothetical protein